MVPIPLTESYRIFTLFFTVATSYAFVFVISVNLADEQIALSSDYIYPKRPEVYFSVLGHRGLFTFFSNFLLKFIGTH